MTQEFNCSAACGIFLDQGSNPCLLHWQVDSLPLGQQGSAGFVFFSNEEMLLNFTLWISVLHFLPSETDEVSILR